MKWHRVQTSLLHSWYHLSHSVETWVDLFWFSIIDIFVFGYMSLYFAKDEQTATFLVLGIMLWEVIRISQYTVSVGMLWEVWSKSFSSLFITPLSIWEFFMGQILSGFIKSVVVFSIISTLAYFIFDFSLTQFGVALPIYFMLLFAFAVATGLFVNALILRFGTTIQSLSWGLIFLFQPLSAIFYPLSILPQPIRNIAYISPITYVMESARYQLTNGTVLWQDLGISALLCVVYLVGACIFLHLMLQWSRKTGAFARMGN